MSLPMPEQGPMMGASGATAPAAVKPDMGGMDIRGDLWGGMAISALMEAAKLLGPTSEKGQACIKSLPALTKVFGQTPRALGEAELKLYQSRLPAMQNPATPGPGAQAALSNLTSGAAPPAAPGVAA